MSSKKIPDHYSEHTCDEKNKCKEDTACKSEGNRSICICYHDGTLPRNGWECPRRTVTGIPPPLNLSRMGSDKHHQYGFRTKAHSHSDHDKAWNTTRYTTTTSTTVDDQLIWFPNMAIPLVLLCITLLSLMLILICFLKRKSIKRIIQFHYSGEKVWKKPHQAILGPGILLPSDRFIMNPTYESSHLLDLSVPVFLPSEINDMVQIGQGCFGNVFRGEINGELIAIKVIKKEHSEEAMKEVETMATFNHPNILHMIGVARNIEMDAPWLIFEFMEYGDLASALRNTPNTGFGGTRPDSFPAEGKPLLHLNKESLLRISYQVAEGMKYLSSQHFVHRDLAARNCLVGKNGIVKISDFGLSRDVYTCDYYKIGGSRLLPVRWMSPESVLYGRFTLESDIWAYGILLWEIYTYGRQPYYGHSNEEVVQLILDGVLLCPPSDCPPIICQMMVGCWKSDPKDRLRFPIICEKFLTTFKENHMNEDCGSNYEIPKSKERVEYMEVI